MKKKALLTSIMTIALCLCLIAGSTYALFTDKTEFNIAVTSGDVEIEAFATINSVYSAKGADAADDEFLIDEFDHNYTHELQTNGYFLNGGTATIDGNNLEIVRLTPGDRVDVDINVTNKSNVAMAYRYKLVSDNTNLATGMVVTIDGVSHEALALWTSEWYPVITAPNGTPNEIPVKTISVELPVYAGNEYQSELTEGKTESVEYTIIVEAVQGNAVTDNESEFVYYQTEVVKEVTPVVDNGRFMENPNTMTVVVEDMYLLGDTYVSLDTDAGIGATIITNSIFDVNGSAIVVAPNMNAVPLTVIFDCEFTLGAGEYIVDGSAYNGYEPMIFIGDDVKVNGEYITQENVASFFKNVGYIGVFDPDLGL